MVAIEILPEARQMLADADDRWIAEHGFVDNPLWDEVDHASDRLRENPKIGIVYSRGITGEVIRRLLLRTGWHLYYSYDALRNTVSIVAVWYAQRGSGPRL